MSTSNNNTFSQSMETQPENNNEEETFGGNLPAEASWSAYFLELRAFQNAFGHANPTKGNLGTWLSHQRSLYCKGDYSPVQAHMLRAMGCTGFDEIDILPQTTEEQEQFNAPEETSDPEDEEQESVGDALPPAKQSIYPAAEGTLDESKTDNVGQPGSPLLTADGSDERDEELVVPPKPQIFGEGVRDNTSTTQPKEPGKGGEKASATSTENIPKTAPAWGDEDHRFWQELQIYERVHCHTSPPQTKGTPDYKLACWLNKQRRLARDGKLESNIHQKFIDLGCSIPTAAPTGSIARAAAREVTRQILKQRRERISSWESRILQLEAYKKQRGHANPHKIRGVSELHFQLASWLADQRVLFCKGLLPSEKAKKLDEVGCSGFGKNKEDELWEAHFMELGLYKQCFGHSKPQKNNDVTLREANLAAWLADQKAQLSNGLLAPKKAKRLCNTGCEGFGTNKEDEHWETHFMELGLYQHCFGHSNPQKNKDVTVRESNLAAWLADQKARFTHGWLSSEKAKRLCEVGCAGFGKNRRGDKRPSMPGVPWETRILQLGLYKHCTGHANPQKSQHVAAFEFDLACWLAYQRALFTNGWLPLEKAQWLHQFGCSGFRDNARSKTVSSARGMSWETLLLDLELYKHWHGHANPQKNKEVTSHGFKLASWLAHQRAIFASGWLQLEKAKRLRKLGCLGFVNETLSFKSRGICVKALSSTPGKPWENQFMKLKAYKLQHGHANVRQIKDSTEAEYQLGSWLARQREKFRNESLPAEEAKRLRELGCPGFDENNRELKRNPVPWEVRFTQLQAFQRRTKHVNPQVNKHAIAGSEEAKDSELANWLRRQRGRLKHPGRAKRLRELGCWGFSADNDPSKKRKRG